MVLKVFDALAEDLPPGARVLDVGAGASRLGQAVAEQREDIRWTNVDFAYYDPDTLEHIARDAPSNVDYVAADIMKLDETFSEGEFDRTFSYWLLPHLSINGSESALQASHQILKATKDGGSIFVGPAKGAHLPYSSRAEQSIHFVKHEDEVEETAQSMVRATRLWTPIRQMQGLTNAAVEAYFETGYYRRRDESGHKELLNPHSGEYVPVVSLGGARVLTELKLAKAGILCKRATVNKCF